MTSIKGKENGRPLGIGLKYTAYDLYVECFENSTSENNWTYYWQNQKTLPPLMRLTVKLHNTQNPENHIELTRVVKVGGI